MLVHEQAVLQDEMEALDGTLRAVAALAAHNSPVDAPQVTTHAATIHIHRQFTFE